MDVYDADTVTLIIPFNNTFYKQKCRLLGIDSAELRTKNLKEKEFATAGKIFLQDLILNKIITVECGEWDKYGRLLGTLYLNDQNINELLIDNEYAYRYDGKKKKNFDDWHIEHQPDHVCS